MKLKRSVACILANVLLLITVCAAEYIDNEYALADVSVSTGTHKTTDVACIKPDIAYLDYYGLGEFTTALPVLHIDTGGERISREEKQPAQMAVSEARANGEERPVLAEPDWQTAITINYRGASSYSQFDKKQYRIKLERKCEFLGMGANDEWVLNGPFLDKTLIRNKLVYGLGRQIFEWAPDSRFVELFVNGEYKGVYLAVEPVTNGESRLRLCEFGLANGQTAYIVKRERLGTEEEPLDVYGHYAGKTNNDLYIDYPTATHITKAQRQWIEKDIDSFERVLYGDGFADEEYGYARYIDVDNFVDYVVLNEAVMNCDAGNLSTYIYKELGGKLQLAIWDYNNCFDNYQWFAADYEEFYMQDVAWFSQLLKDRAFVDKVVNRYYELREGILSEEYLYGQIDAYIEELGDAVDRNYAIWGYTFYSKMLIDTNELRINPTSYEEAVAQLKGAIHMRLTFLDENITRLYEGCIN